MFEVGDKVIVADKAFLFNHQNDYPRVVDGMYVYSGNTYTIRSRTRSVVPGKYVYGLSPVEGPRSYFWAGEWLRPLDEECTEISEEAFDDLLSL